MSHELMQKKKKKYNSAKIFSIFHNVKFVSWKGNLTWHNKDHTQSGEKQKKVIYKNICSVNNPMDLFSYVFS